ncbi:uncharacterized protein [Atheta coriaria]|uniref:uncharacterized protein n=1 Tax=Dalotia coriaria TaxID=877792 RepID=UPI0031F3DA9B
MPSVSFADLDKANMSYHHEMSSSYDYVRRASDDLNRYKLSDLIEMDEFEEDFFGNRLHNYSSTLPKTLKTFNSSFDNAYNTFKNYKSPFENRTCFIRDLFEDVDFFGNPIISYPPRRSSLRRDHSPDYFKDDPFKDYTSSSYSSYSKPPKGFSRERSNSRERSRERSPSLRRTSLGSTGFSSSMDALWDLHPRAG